MSGIITKGKTEVLVENFSFFFNRFFCAADTLP